jgi:hypothetical protein
VSHAPEGAGPAPAGYEPPLALHIVCAVATEHARSLFAHLFEDPDDLTAHGLRVPVRLWRSTSDAEVPPPAVPPLHEAARNAVVVLIDDELIATEGWLAFLDELAASMRPNDALLGVALTETALAIDSPLLDRNMIRLYAHAEHLRRVVLVNRVTHALCRLAAGSEEPVRVFVSHAKIDGLAIAQRVRAFLHGETGIGDFFDAQDLIEGSPWVAQIRGAAAANVLLAVRTDRYPSREWCRTEVLQAKLAGSPVIVLDALEQLEARGFPGGGRVQSALHFRARADVARAARAADGPGRAARGAGERSTRLPRSAARDRRACAGAVGRADLGAGYPEHVNRTVSKLAGLVGISVSDPGDAELRLRGLAADHVTHLFIELARQVLAAGGDLAYGGDLCAEGYTQTLVSLLRTYFRADRPSRSRVRQYLARYVWEPMSTSEASALAAYLTPVRVAGGGDAEDDRVARALDLTAMRRQMSGEIEARVLLGGRLSGQLGRWPGVVEEAYLALAAGRPLFVCGGIGGAGARIAEALGGAWPDELTDEFQRGASGLGYQALVEARRRCAPRSPRPHRQTACPRGRTRC